MKRRFSKYQLVTIRSTVKGAGAGAVIRRSLGVEQGLATYFALGK